MSTLQHTSKPANWMRLGRGFVVVVAVLVALAVASTVAIVIGTSGSTPQSPAHLSAAGRQAQLGAYGGPRVGMARPVHSRPATAEQLQRQLEAAAGPRYGQQLGFQTQR